MAISSKETYSILRDCSDKKIDFEEKTDVYSETCQIISHMGSPEQESCTPGSTGASTRPRKWCFQLEVFEKKD